MIQTELERLLEEGLMERGIVLQEREYKEDIIISAQLDDITGEDEIGLLLDEVRRYREDIELLKRERTRLIENPIQTEEYKKSMEFYESERRRARQVISELEISPHLTPDQRFAVSTLWYSEGIFSRVANIKDINIDYSFRHEHKPYTNEEDVEKILSEKRPCFSEEITIIDGLNQINVRIGYYTEGENREAFVDCEDRGTLPKINEYIDENGELDVERMMETEDFGQFKPEFIRMNPLEVAGEFFRIIDGVLLRYG